MAKKLFVIKHGNIYAIGFTLREAKSNLDDALHLSTKSRAFQEALQNVKAR